MKQMMEGLPLWMGDLAARRIEDAAEHLPEAQRRQYLETLQAAATSAGPAPAVPSEGAPPTGSPGEATP